jgi:aspartokinase-like uncharacterized kinase
MRVIKLGGSLMQNVGTLTHCLNIIEQKNKDKVVIVPGGGIFADQVRGMQQQWQFDDKIAHQMAILAMQQMALLLNSLNTSFVLANTISAIKQALLSHAVVIWSPDITELALSEVKESWDVTSDSLAAWLATQLTVNELILVKSVKIPQKTSIQQMQKQGIVDQAFNEYALNSIYKITLINQHCFNEYLFT